MNWKLMKIGFTLVVGICLVAFISMTDLSEVSMQIKKIGFGFIWLILLSFGAFVMGSIAWKYCFENHQNISIWKLFFIRTIGETITVINPTNIVAGEASKVALLQQENLTKREKLDSILISRVILISSQLMLTLVCLLYVAYRFQFVMPAFFILVGFVFILISLYKFIDHHNKQISLSKSHKLWRKLRYLQIQCVRFKRRFETFVEYRKKQIFIAFVCSTIHWFFGASELFIILHYLGIDASLINALTVDMGVVIVKSIGGFVPAQIGVEEFGNKYMLALTGVTGAGIWISVSILRRTKQLFWIAVSTLFYICIEFILPTKKHKHGSIIYNS